MRILKEYAGYTVVNTSTEWLSTFYTLNYQVVAADRILFQQFLGISLLKMAPIARKYKCRAFC